MGCQLRRPILEAKDPDRQECRSWHESIPVQSRVPHEEAAPMPPSQHQKLAPDTRNTLPDKAGHQGRELELSPMYSWHENFDRGRDLIDFFIGSSKDICGVFASAGQCCRS